MSNYSESRYRSKIWKDRKDEYYAKYKKLCSRCGTRKYIHLHHLDYSEEFGKESDVNLIPLCQRCHFDVHKLYDKNKVFMTLRETTVAFLNDDPILVLRGEPITCRSVPS